MRDLNFKYLAEGKGAPVTARFGPDGITLCDPNRATESAGKVLQKISRADPFTRSRFELLCAGCIHYQELTPLPPCASVDAAAKVRDRNFKYLAQGEGARSV